MKGVTVVASLIDGGNYVLIWSMINNDTRPYLMSSIMGGDPRGILLKVGTFQTFRSRNIKNTIILKATGVF